MGKFTRRDTAISELCIVEPAAFGDSRGFFMETYNQRDFAQMGIDATFVQDNHSKSSRGVLRGLHFQRRHVQGKLVRVVAGAVLDVAVDLRPESATYGKWESVVLSAENRLMFYIPPRFAHGFVTLEDDTEFLYKCTDVYDPQSESGIVWNDASLGVDWQLERWGIDGAQLLISSKDLSGGTFKSLNPNTLWQ